MRPAQVYNAKENQTRDTNVKHTISMKNIAVALLSLALVFGLSACGWNGAISLGKNIGAQKSVDAFSELASAAHEAMDSEVLADIRRGQSGTFQVSPEMPLFQYAISTDVFGGSIEYSRATTVTQVVITVADTGSVIQTIIPPDGNFNDLKSSIYFIDVTFDGYIDLLVPILDSAYWLWFDAYIWDTTSGQFIEAPSFQNVWNPAIDESNQRIFTKVGGDKSFSWSIWTFTDGQFVRENSIYFHDDPSGQSYVKVIETQCSGADSEEIIVHEYYVKGPVYFDEPELAHYCIPGSFWDLDSPRWNSPFWSEIK